MLCEAAEEACAVGLAVVEDHGRVFDSGAGKIREKAVEEHICARGAAKTKEKRAPELVTAGRTVELPGAFPARQTSGIRPDTCQFREGAALHRPGPSGRAPQSGRKTDWPARAEISVLDANPTAQIGRAPRKRAAYLLS